MKMPSALILPLFVHWLAFPAWAASVPAKLPVEISPTPGDVAYRGELLLPKEIKPGLPLVIVVHEWWGKTEHPENRGRRIADELGYAALVVDLYGAGKVVAKPAEAQALATPFYKEPKLGVALLRDFTAAAVSAASRAHVAIDSSKIAAIGFCFGGTQVLNLARAGGLPDDEKLVGVVSFHGGLGSTLPDATPIKTKLLVLSGGADPMVPPADVEAFKKEMKKRDADLTFKSYPGALHAFTNPKATEIGKANHMPVAYNEAADKDSWKQMTEFLAKVFLKQ